MEITIRTRLDAGIYRSSGGGEERVHYTWTAGPLKLLRAARMLSKHRASMERGFGNVGCGRSWLQIGDQRIADDDLPGSLDEARDILARAQSGAYAAEKVRIARELAEYDAAERARSDAKMAREMADEAERYRQAEAERLAAAEADDAAAAAAWAAELATQAEAARIERASIAARQAQRQIRRNMERDWRRAGC